MRDTGYSHSFPALKGTQAGQDFFVAMCPMRMIPKLFVFDEQEVPAELRAQRTLNRSRIPEIANYLAMNRNSYVLSALTASIDSEVVFTPIQGSGPNLNIGVLSVPMDARILINDGQHRRAAIEEAIKDVQELGHDNVPVLFFVDQGLHKSQQMFADLNKYAVRPSNSLGTLYDLRDPGSALARYLAQECVVFRGLTEMEKSTISNRSTKLFTLSGIKHASRALLQKQLREEISAAEKLIAKEYWEAVSQQIPDWGQAREKSVAPADLRQNYIHAHGIALHALGVVGASLLAARPKNWRLALQELRRIDWLRSNTSLWEGRAMQHGRISKASVSVQLTSNLLKATLGLPLTEEEQQLEATLR
jgi:DNA sulfur modification protein DndB